MKLYPNGQRRDNYHAREEEHIYIDQPQATELFKTYRIVFGKITEIGEKPTTLRKTRNPKYIKISDNKWYDIAERSRYINWEHTYEGFHPLEKLKELYMPNMYNSIHIYKTKIDAINEPLLEQSKLALATENLALVAQYGIEDKECINVGAHYIYAHPHTDFRTQIRLIYNIPWVVCSCFTDRIFDTTQAYYERLCAKEISVNIERQLVEPITKKIPTAPNKELLRQETEALDGLKSCKQLLEQIGATRLEDAPKINKYKQYEAMMTIRTIMKKINDVLTSTAAEEGDKLTKKKEYVVRQTKQIKRLITATNMLPTDETIDKAKNIIIQALQIQVTDKENKEREKLWQKIDGVYSLTEEDNEAREAKASSYVHAIAYFIARQMTQYDYDIKATYDKLLHEVREANKEKSLYEEALKQNPLSLSDIKTNE